MLAGMIGVSVVTFAVSHVIPADPVAAALAITRARIRSPHSAQSNGLDKPLLEQYVIYAGNLLRGNLGVSTARVAPSPRTCGFLPCHFGTVTCGARDRPDDRHSGRVWSSVMRNRLPDHVVRIFSLIGDRFPIFWLGLIFIGLFYSRLGWLPGGGRIGQFAPPPRSATGPVCCRQHPGRRLARPPSRARSTCSCPLFTLGYYSTAVIARMMRSTCLKTLNQDYMRTARAKGLRERMVVLRHAFRNALILP